MNEKNREVSIVGYACRLPEASNADQFWDVLTAGRCVISAVKPDRWATERFVHPNPAVPGKTYTWAAGQIDNVWEFDPGFFGISPREAVQMDPQQRLLLQVVWESLEHAGLPPSSLAGSKTGVFIGASSLDYSNRFLFDPSAGDVQFMTGNTLSIISNRISYIFDLRGPSFTVDTACSSSLIALHEAYEALSSGQIDTAIVGGVHLLLSPFAFLGFSRASMLSPSGLCRAFDADGDGYVRSEGAVALVLRADKIARRDGNTAHAMISGTGINSDGRTVGLSLPSAISQADLLRDVYAESGIDPNDLVFIEAHGTGTRVGDPAEANALGEILGQKRAATLPIGSVKTNIGHLEPASGVAGLLKSILALKHDLLPASLHFNTPNPDIPFNDLNLSVVDQNLSLAKNGKPRYAGINSFGFGGANAHVIVRDPEPLKRGPETGGKDGAPLIISAQCAAALDHLVADYRDLIAASNDTSMGAIVNSAAHTRDRLAYRAVAFGRTQEELVTSLEEADNGRRQANFSQGQAIGNDLPVAFLFSGNGSQWAGMGRTAYQVNPVFRKSFEAVDRQFMRLSGWSLLTTLFSPELEGEIERTEIAQPLLFALQVAIVEALAEQGVSPAAVAGHSVGEVAAAWACGGLSLSDAVQVIHARSTHQEITRHLGSMAALLLPADQAEAAIAGDGFAGIELAAINSPRSVTISGPTEQLDAFGKFARRNRWAMRRLDLSYPFHCALVDPIRDPLLDSLGEIRPQAGKVPFYSTVDADPADDRVLDKDYWWRNVRQPVLFHDAMTRMADDGYRVFLEIGPRPVLATYARDTLRASDRSGTITQSLDKSDDEAIEPIARVAADVLVAGGKVDITKFVGRRRRISHDLPSYPWQNDSFSAEETSESYSYFAPSKHFLLGHRLRPEISEWFNHIDAVMFPWLADHKVEDMVVFPAAGFVEMALSAGREWLGCDDIEIQDLDIFRPMVLNDDQILETLVRIMPDSLGFEISSRDRLSDGDWSVHVRGRLAKAIGGKDLVAESRSQDIGETLTADTLYAITRQFGLNYGPAFRRAAGATRRDRQSAHLTFAQAEPGFDDRNGFSFHPTLLDSAFHGLFVLLPEGHSSSGKVSFLPVRIGSLITHGDPMDAVGCDIDVVRASTRSIEARFRFLDDNGGLVAEITGARFRAVPLAKSERPDELVYRTAWSLLPQDDRSAAAGAYIDDMQKVAEEKNLICEVPPALDEDWLLMEAAIRPIALSAVKHILGDGGHNLSLSQLVSAGELDPTAIPLMARLLQCLEDGDLMIEEDGEWTLNNGDATLPDPGDILRTLIADYPLRIAEVTALTRAKTVLVDLLRNGLPESLTEVFAKDLITQLRAHTPTIEPLERTIVELATEIAGNWSEDVPLRVLVVGGVNHSFIRAISERIDRRIGSLTVTDANQSALESSRLAIDGTEHINWLSLDELTAQGNGNAFDLILSVNHLHELLAESGALDKVVSIATADARILAAEPAPVLLHDFVNGLAQDWWSGVADPEYPIGQYRSAEEWIEDLQSIERLADIEATPIAASGTEGALLTIRVGGEANDDAAKAVADGQDDEPPRRIIVLTGSDNRETAVAEALQSAISDAHVEAASVSLGEGEADVICSQAGADIALNDLVSDDKAAEIVFVHGAWLPDTGPLSATLSQTEILTRLLQTVGTRLGRLWIVAPGANQSLIGGTIHRPVQTAVWGYGRVAMNEYPDLEIRMIDIIPTLEPGEAAGRLAAEISHPGDEREIVIDANRRCGLRMVAGGALPDPDDSGTGQAAIGYRLDIVNQGSLDGLAWHRVARPRPSANEVQIEVAAAGLNFRDVMWALGMLPEEALEDGFAGATLGMECAGTVVSVGDSVTRFKVGDRVLAFAPACFASHVTVADYACAPVPDAIELAEAATLPVTFLTAYYALVHLAHLEEGETVLIHGGAGGVGLAALQIAKWRGATVIATAGTEEKRDLLRAMRADYVFDSRSLDFAEEIRDLTKGDGVDVVLNSLFGEAMERSIGLLKPFGRFLELGKRDYYANTMVGLRPFRRNLSYFGIDADQLMVEQPKLASKIFRDLGALFESGAFSPLPYRLFPGDAITDAFRLMQQSGHIGKIVIQPPQPNGEKRVDDRPIVRADGTYLIVGGFGGFGLETAQWLIDQGARNLVLVGRRGAASDEAKSALSKFEDQGATIRSAAVDATDSGELARLLTDVSSSMPPIRGILHTAMVLDDALILNLDAERIEKVLRPKVLGAHNLDRASRGLDLDFFVLFSSATTMVGNPGQANYVAANAYLEGLARQRRAEGLPALAVAWGAISDAGYLARNMETNDVLSTRLGRHALTARDALEGLGLLLHHGSLEVSEAAIAYARIDWGAARKELAIVKSSLFSDFLGDLDYELIDGDAQVDLSELLSGLDRGQAVEAMSKLLAAEIAKILRMPAEEIDRHRPLSEIGMDSLMALELRMGAEKRLGIDIPLMSLANGATLNDICNRVVARHFDGAGDDLSREAETLAVQHVDSEHLEGLDLAEIAASVEEKSEDVRNLLK